MDRRRFLQLTATGALAAATAPAGLTGCAGGARRPDVLLIVVDSLRADHLGCYGHDRDVSPNLDALAADSILFRRCYAAAPWTTASVASMLSSQFPSTLGLRDQVVGFDRRHPTLPGVLGDNGYRTEGIVSVDMLSRQLGFDRGFDAYDDSNYTGRDGLTSPLVARKAQQLLKAPHAQPLFALLHVFDPHYNYVMHPDWDFDAGYQGPLHSNQEILDLWAKLDELDERDVEFLLAAYDSEIAFTDGHLGAVIDRLKDQGRYDDTMIIVTGDHGEEFLERGWLGHSISVHREQIHVPLLVKLPGNRSADADEPVSLLDIMPSLLRWLDIEAPDGLEGTAHDWDRPDRTARRPVFSETFHAQRHRPGGMGNIGRISVQLGDRKMIRDEVRRSTRIYDLVTDPGEEKGLRVGRGEEDQLLLRLLSEWSEHVDVKRRGASTTGVETLLDAEQLRRLESLGYI